MKNSRRSFKIPTITVTDPDQVFIISYKRSISDRKEVNTDTIHVPIKRQDSSTGSTRSAADFEKAIKETGYGKFNYLLLLLAFPAACSPIYDTNSLSYVLPTATCEMQLDAFDRGYLNASIYLGMILSSFVWGFLSDKFGRQRILVFGYLGDVVFGIGTSLSQSFWSLLAFKVLCGIMISGPTSVLMSYMSELFSAKRRDSIVMVVGLFQSIGGCLQPLLAWAVIPQDIKWSLFGGRVVLNSWRLFLLITTLFPLIAGVGSAFCHESPRFLMAKGRKAEALRVFQSIYSVNTGHPGHTYSVKKLKNDFVSSEKHKKRTLCEELTALYRPPYVHKALLAFFIQFGCLMTLPTIKVWLPQLFFQIKQIKEDESFNTCTILSFNQSAPDTSSCDSFHVDTSVYTNMLYVNLLTALSLAISTILVAFIGKRSLLVSLFLAQSAVVCSVGWVSPPFTQSLLALFVALSSATATGLISLVVQIFPTTLRTMAVSATMISGRVGVVLGNSFFPFLLAQSCPGTFIFVSTITLCCSIVAYTLGAPESK